MDAIIMVTYTVDSDDNKEDMTREEADRRIVSSTSKTSPLSPPRSSTNVNLDPIIMVNYTVDSNDNKEDMTREEADRCLSPRRFLRLDPCLCLRLPSLRVLDHLSTLGFLLLVGSFLFFHCVIVFRHTLYSFFT